MIDRVVIRDNENTPIHYLSDLKAFKNGTEYVFKEGVNVIVGKNGCGKTTLMDLIKRYLLVDFTECGRGLYNCNVTDLYKGFYGEGFLNGVDVFADYKRNTFRLSHAGEKEKYQAAETAEDFVNLYNQNHASTGEGVVIALNTLFSQIFNKKTELMFDYDQFKDDIFGEYGRYIKEHRIEGNEWTILMDEPDRNLDIENIGSIKEILSFHKPQTQVIAVVHNPLLIVALSRNPEVNIIEMTKGYVKQVTKLVNDLVKK